MKTTRGAQVGFSLVEIVLVVAVMAILGATGWYVYRHHHEAPKQAANSVSSSSQSTTKSTSSSTARSAQPATTYLTISQWDVRLTLTSPISDAYYVVPIGVTPDPDGLPSDIIVGVHSLDSACGAVTTNPAEFTNSLGEIIRTQAGVVDPVTRELYTQEYPYGVTIGGYYYGFLATGTSRTCTSASNLQSIDSAFEAAVKNMVSTQ